MPDVVLPVLDEAEALPGVLARMPAGFHGTGVKAGGSLAIGDHQAEYVCLLGMLAAPNLGKDYAARFNPIYPQLAEKYDATLVPFFLQPERSQRTAQLTAHERHHVLPPVRDQLDVL